MHKFLRQCVKTAKRCPEENHRRTMLEMIRNRWNREKFYEGRRAQVALADAREELESMQYLLDLKQQKHTSRPTLDSPSTPPKCTQNVVHFQISKSSQLQLYQYLQFISSFGNITSSAFQQDHSMLQVTFATEQDAQRCLKEFPKVSVCDLK